jgi:hypothetical protein
LFDFTLPRRGARKKAKSQSSQQQHNVFSLEFPLRFQSILAGLLSRLSFNVVVRHPHVLLPALD